jgi:hypothetical protein
MVPGPPPLRKAGILDVRAFMEGSTKIDIEVQLR